MTGEKSLHPTVLWAQRRDVLYVTISLVDVKNKTLDLKEDCLIFKGSSGSPKLQDYAVTLNFHSEVDPEKSRQMSTDREIVMLIHKKKEEYWPRLLSEASKYPWLKIDFNRWVDENESEPEMPGMDNNFASMMSQMSNFKDYGGDEADVDSDDEDLPDLEPPNKEVGEMGEFEDHSDEEEIKQETNGVKPDVDVSA